MVLEIDQQASYEQRWGWRDPENYVFKPRRGLDREIVEEISFMKDEPKWMRDFRLRSYDRFERRPMPTWTGPDLTKLDFQNIYYFMRAVDKQDRDDWQEVPEGIRNTFDRLGIPEAEQKRLIAGVSAQYECLRGSTLVWTDRGMVPIKAVEPGDCVFSLDEATKQIVEAKVTGAACSGVKQVFEIRAGGRVIGASANHPFLVAREERNPGRRARRLTTGWVAVEDLRAGDYVAVATAAPDFGKPASLLLPAGGEHLPARTTDDLAWWTGVFIGAGSLGHCDAPTSVEIAIDQSDLGLVNEIIRVSRALFGLEFSAATDGRWLTARGTGALAEYLYLNHIAGNVHTKRIPEWAFGLPRSQRLSLIAGYLDADGYVRAHTTSHGPVLSSVNAALAEDVRQLCAPCGIGSSEVTEERNRHPYENRYLTAYHLHLSARFDVLPCRSSRRRARPARQTAFRSDTSDSLEFVRVESIDPAGAEAVYDIEVAGHHNFVAGGFVVHNSEVVYHKVQEELEAKGVIFTDMDSAVRDYPDLVREYFAKVIPPNDNKLAALNSAVWSGGSFIYVPKGVQVDIPLQAYFRINAENVGQFERTLIIADEGAYVHYVEGCTAPVYTSDSLHSAVVELWARPHARIRYTTIQNWAGNVYNLVTKRAVAEEASVVEWVDGNLGSRVTVKYPAVVLKGRKAHGEVLSLAMAGEGQHQDTGAKMTHAAAETTSTIVSKSISKDGGRTTYRGLVQVLPEAAHSKSNVRCDALLVDDHSQSDTYPYMDIQHEDVEIGHEATVAKIGDDQLFYLRSRGICEAEASAMIVRGFVEPIVKQLPMEYAVELNRLIELQMEGSVG